MNFSEIKLFSVSHKNHAHGFFSHLSSLSLKSSQKKPSSSLLLGWPAAPPFLFHRRSPPSPFYFLLLSRLSSPSSPHPFLLTLVSYSPALSAQSALHTRTLPAFDTTRHCGCADFSQRQLLRLSHHLPQLLRWTHNERWRPHHRPRPLLPVALPSSFPPASRSSTVSSLKLSKIPPSSPDPTIGMSPSTATAPNSPT